MATMPKSCAGDVIRIQSEESAAPSAMWLRALADRLQQQAERRLGRTLRQCPPHLIDLASNDYLNLRTHPHLVEAAQRAAAQWGVGSGASRLVSGTTDLHMQVEARVAAFKGAEAALIVPTGYMANLALLTALPQPGDLILMDRLNHASLIDAAMLSAGGARASRTGDRGISGTDEDRIGGTGESKNGGTGVSPVFRRFRHKDIAHARELACRHRTHLPHSTIWLVSDSVFSMDGDIADIRALSRLRDELLNCCLILDEAHATGLMGSTGAGADEAAGHLADICVSTASKALGSLGGVITGPRLVIDAIVNFARPFIFTTAVPPTQLAAIDAALDVVQAEPDRRRRVADMAHALREALANKGWPTEALGDDPTPIIPLIVGDAESAIELAATLERAGFDAPAIRPPSVPKGTSRVRISVHAGLTEPELQRLVAAIPGRQASRD